MNPRFEEAFANLFVSYREKVELRLGKERAEKYRSLEPFLQLAEYRLESEKDDVEQGLIRLFDFDTLHGKKPATQKVIRTLAPVLWAAMRIKYAFRKKADPRPVFSSSFTRSPRYARIREPIEQDVGCTQLVTFLDAVRIDKLDKKEMLRETFRLDAGHMKPVFLPGTSMAGRRLEKAAVEYYRRIRNMTFGTEEQYAQEIPDELLDRLQKAYLTRVKWLKKYLAYKGSGNAEANPTRKTPGNTEVNSTRRDSNNPEINSGWKDMGNTEIDPDRKDTGNTEVNPTRRGSGSKAPTLYLTVNQYNLRDLLVIAACRDLGIPTIQQEHHALEFLQFQFYEDRPKYRFSLAGSYGYWSPTERLFHQKVFRYDNPLYPAEDIRFLVTGDTEITYDQALGYLKQYPQQRKLTFVTPGVDLETFRTQEQFDTYAAWRWKVFEGLREFSRKQNIKVCVRYRPGKEQVFREKEIPTLKEWGFEISRSVPENLMEDLCTSMAVMSSATSAMATARLLGKPIYRVEDWEVTWIHVDDTVREVKLADLPNLTLPDAPPKPLNPDCFFDINRLIRITGTRSD